MWSESEKTILLRAKEILGLNWIEIGKLFDKSADSCRKMYTQLTLIEQLGEKPIIKQSIITPEIGRQIKSLVDESPKMTVRSLEEELATRYPPGTPLPKKTAINDYLRSLNFKWAKAVKRQFISLANIKKRLDFAREYSQKEDTFWDLVIWSDETMVRKAPAGRDLHFWIRRGRDDNSAEVNFQFQQGGFGVMFWGCFSRFGVGPLVALEKSMDSDVYVEILREFVFPQVKTIKKEFGVDMVFMQDNARCHTSKKTTDVLNAHGLQTLPWPPQSPDLNPIENLWSVLKRRREKKFGMPRSKAELIEQVFDIWENIEPELIETLCDSAIRRLIKCIEVNGNHTGY